MTGGRLYCGRLWRLLLPFYLLMLAAMLPGCGGASPPGDSGAEVAPVAVRTVEPRRLDGAAAIRVAGVVRPVRRAQMGTRQAGTVEAVLVAAGDRVEAGQLILRVDARDLEAAHEAARERRQAAQLAWDTAERNRNRYQRLFDERLIAKARLEEAELQASQAQGLLAAAEAELEAVAINLDYANLRAPFSGYVSEVLAETGAFVVPGPPLVVFEDRDRLEVDAAVDQATATRLLPGEMLSLRFDGVEKPLQARVQALLPALKEPGVGRRLRLLIEEPLPAVSPGMVAEVHIPAREAAGSRFSIPASAHVARGQLDGVFLVEPGEDGHLRARLRWVSLAQEGGEPGRLVVLNGLSGGERVAVGEVVGRLVDDQRVVLEGQ